MSTAYHLEPAAADAIFSAVTRAYSVIGCTLPDNITAARRPDREVERTAVDRIRDTADDLPAALYAVAKAGKDATTDKRVLAALAARQLIERASDMINEAQRREFAAVLAGHLDDVVRTLGDTIEQAAKVVAEADGVDVTRPTPPAGLPGGALARWAAAREAMTLADEAVSALRVVAELAAGARVREELRPYFVADLAWSDFLTLDRAAKDAGRTASTEVEAIAAGLPIHVPDLAGLVARFASIGAKVEQHAAEQAAAEAAARPVRRTAATLEVRGFGA